MMMQRPVQPATRRVQHPAAGRCGLDREAGPGPSYGDLLDDGTRAGLANDFTNRNTTFCLGTNAFAPQHLLHPTELVFLGLLSLSHTDACGLRVMSMRDSACRGRRACCSWCPLGGWSRAWLVGLGCFRCGCRRESVLDLA